MYICDKFKHEMARNKMIGITFPIISIYKVNQLNIHLMNVMQVLPSFPVSFNLFSIEGEEIK